MGRYDDLSREELIRRIEALENPSKADADAGKRYRERYACEILDSIPDMLTVLGRDGSMIELVSSEQTNHVGAPSEQLVGKYVSDILAPEACRSVMDNLRRVFASGRGSASHHDITLDGVTRNYENRIMPLDERHALCICRDITDTERAKHELEMVKYALNNVEEEIYACTMDGSMLYANLPFRRHHGIADDLALHKVWEYWGYQGTVRQWKERVQQIRHDGGSHKYTVRFKDQDERIVAWEIDAYIIFDDFGKQEVVWFFGRDVTVRLEQQTKVKEMNTILDSILNNIPVYLFVKDPSNEFRYLYWNRTFEEFSRIPASKALGRTDLEIFPSPKDAEKFRRDDLALLRSGKRMTFVEEYVTASGETRVVNTSKSLVPIENRLPLIIGISWDITETKNAEMEIIEARIRAEEADKLKTAFLANMSHEIRTPLNAIVGFSKLLGTAETEEEKQQYIDIIDTNSDLLLQLINDILDLSKIEAGTLEFHFREVDLDELCRAAYEVHKTRLKPGVELRYEAPPGPARIVSDHNRLSQVLTNLISNASKFTEKGFIRFGFSMRDDCAEFFVEDTGMGIPSDKVEQIFARFVKLNEFAAGTGLGLAISKMIVERLDGSIEVKSEQGRGTRFRFRIPLSPRTDRAEASPEADRPCPSPDCGTRWKLLVVEDADINYRFIEAVLSRRFELIRAYNGREAVEMFDSTGPDAVLMNVRLPIMDGFEATRLIRERSKTVPVIAMSAYSFGNEVEGAREAGCNDFLAKPLSQYSLNKALNACLVDLKK